MVRASWIRQTPPLCLHFETPSHETFRCCSSLPLPRRSFNNGLSKCIAVWRKETRPLPDHRPTTRADKEICEQPRVLELLDRRGGDRVLIYILYVRMYECRGVVRWNEISLFTRQNFFFLIHLWRTLPRNGVETYGKPNSRVENAGIFLLSILKLIITRFYFLVETRFDRLSS